MTRGVFAAHGTARACRPGMRAAKRLAETVAGRGAQPLFPGAVHGDVADSAWKERKEPEGGLRGIWRDGGCSRTRGLVWAIAVGIPYAARQLGMQSLNRPTTPRHAAPRSGLLLGPEVPCGVVAAGPGKKLRHMGGELNLERRLVVFLSCSAVKPCEPPYRPVLSGRPGPRPSQLSPDPWGPEGPVKTRPYRTATTVRPVRPGRPPTCIPAAPSWTASAKQHFSRGALCHGKTGRAAVPLATHPLAGEPSLNGRRPGENRKKVISKVQKAFVGPYRGASPERPRINATECRRDKLEHIAYVIKLMWVMAAKGDRAATDGDRAKNLLLINVIWGLCL